MAERVALDSNWLRDHPLPPLDPAADKNSRGRVLAIGGCDLVPGGLLLTGEAALRAGAGKLQMATIQRAALGLGLAMPEAAVIPLAAGDDGEIADPGDRLCGALAACDAVVVGPAMSCRHAAGRLVDAALGAVAAGGSNPASDRPASERRPALVLDAAALMGLAGRDRHLCGLAVPAIVTPHLGEMAALLGRPAKDVDADRVAAVHEASARYHAVVALKGPTTLVAAPDGTLLAYAGGGAGLATGGSGDVLAGLAAGLAARGAAPLVATGWAVWLHGEAGRRCAERMGPVGFLARELLALVPGLMRAL